MAQIIPVVSDALQATIRRLLPTKCNCAHYRSTPSAEGSTLPREYQTAFGYGDTTAIEILNATSDIVTNTGFYRIFGTYYLESSSGVVTTVRMALDDGTIAQKNLFVNKTSLNANTGAITNHFDFVVFLDAGIKLIGQTDSSNGVLNVASRQIADISGNLVNPSGFVFQ